MRTPILLSSCVVAATLAVSAAAQEQAPQAPHAPVRARPQAESTQAFLNHRQSEQSARNARIADQANLRELNGIVRAVTLVLPSPSFVTDQTQLAALRESFLVDVAQSLALLGFKAGDLRRDQAAGARLVGAAAAKIRGTATIEDEVALADTVIIGTVQATRAQDRGDGLHSSVDIAAEQVFRGNEKAGDVVAVRRLSGPTGEKTAVRMTSEEPIPAGAKVALIGSKARYLNAHAGLGPRCDACVVEQVPLFLVTGTAMVPTGGYSKSAPVSVLASATR
jgi:hypothetical protein